MWLLIHAGVKVNPCYFQGSSPSNLAPTFLRIYVNQIMFLINVYRKHSRSRLRFIIAGYGV